MTKALGIIDAQRGFMPATEEFTPNYGFGELPVANGHEIVPILNRLIAACALAGHRVFTTQDWHPHRTAHFAAEDAAPNFVTTWPVHCVDGTLGAELHPDLQLPGSRERFIKGFDALERGEDDTSYSGYYAVDPVLGHSLPELLEKHHVTEVLLGGLALDYCVGKTALDLRTKLGLDVIVAIDATRGIAPDSVDAMLDDFQRAGVQTTTTDEWLQEFAA
ncbi:MAG TPA: isochorismatase family protein [Candidatus Saccharimonadales bacterium]|nr:isochorismatase family protein [Candidatus Saccharimonadales bacterium]